MSPANLNFNIMKLKFLFSMILAFAFAVTTVDAQVVKATDKVKAYEKIGPRTINKVPTVADIIGDVRYVTTDYTVKDNDRVLCINSTDSLLIVTVPVSPGYPHRFWINFAKGGSNNLILQGGTVDTLTSSQTKFYFFDTGIPQWRKFSF